MRQKTQQKPGKTHTKIAADAKKPNKSQEKHIQKSPRTQRKNKQNQGKQSIYMFFPYIIHNLPDYQKT